MLLDCRRWAGSRKSRDRAQWGAGYVTVKNFQLGSTQFTGGGAGLSFTDSADGVQISRGDDLLAIVSWQTASSFRSNVSTIFA
ncbi:MAG: hypothetical protein HC895_03260 [Leptolyngbyaceae cyanobacterium SM1_3_5]|nr:hypothetical protein [Leptolyngbyaceae cyanobacterium SM1_3_5]